MYKELNGVLSKFDELDKMYNKITLYERKRDKMGLTDEEENILKHTRYDYFIRCEEIIGEIVEIFINKVITEEGKEALEHIQQYIPWDGKIIIHEKDIDSILESISKLDAKSLRLVKKSLKTLHSEVFESINDACQEEDILEGFDRLGVIITNGKEDSDIMDSLSYIDAIYREFGELLGVKLKVVTVEEYN